MRLRHTAIFTLLAAAWGCGSLGIDTLLGPESEGRSRLEVNRERWQQVRPASYSMVLKRLCFCTELGIGPVRIDVVGTTATRRVYVESGEPVSADLAPYFPTVDGLFDVLVDAMNHGAHQIEVTYDGETGIPVDIWIDYDAGLADEEQGYQVTLPLG